METSINQNEQGAWVISGICFGGCNQPTDVPGNLKVPIKLTYEQQSVDVTITKDPQDVETTWVTPLGTAIQNPETNIKVTSGSTILGDRRYIVKSVAWCEVNPFNPEPEPVITRELQLRTTANTCPSTVPAETSITFKAWYVVKTDGQITTNEDVTNEAGVTFVVEGDPEIYTRNNNVLTVNNTKPEQATIKVRASYQAVDVEAITSELVSICVEGTEPVVQHLEIRPTANTIACDGTQDFTALLMPDGQDVTDNSTFSSVGDLPEGAELVGKTLTADNQGTDPQTAAINATYNDMTSINPSVITIQGKDQPVPEYTYTLDFINDKPACVGIDEDIVTVKAILKTWLNGVLVNEQDVTAENNIRYRFKKNPGEVVDWETYGTTGRLKIQNRPSDSVEVIIEESYWFEDAEGHRIDVSDETNFCIDGYVLDVKYEPTPSATRISLPYNGTAPFRAILTRVHEGEPFNPEDVTMGATNPYDNPKLVFNTSNENVSTITMDPSLPAEHVYNYLVCANRDFINTAYTEITAVYKGIQSRNKIEVEIQKFLAENEAGARIRYDYYPEGEEHENSNYYIYLIVNPDIADCENLKWKTDVEYDYKYFSGGTTGQEQRFVSFSGIGPDILWNDGGQQEPPRDPDVPYWPNKAYFYIPRDREMAEPDIEGDTIVCNTEFNPDTPDNND